MNERAAQGLAGEVTPQVTEEVGPKLGLSRDQVLILQNLAQDRSIAELMALLERSNRTKFRDQVLNPLLDADLAEMTIPDKPRSSKQRYRLTDKGRQVLEEAGESE
jgi:ATP-dependent DNA helicase RecG